MKEIKDRFDIEEVNDEFINEVLPNAEELDLTVNQVKVLALLKYISRSADIKDKDGYFFVENDFIRRVCKIGSKSTLNNAFGVLMELGYIDRKSSKIVGKASKYCVLTCTPTCTPQLYTEEVTDNQVVTENKNATCTPNCTNNCTRNCTIDTDIDIESDSESHKDSESDIYNIFYKILYNILNKILEEKEKTSSIENNKKEKDTLMEETLQEQINQLKEQNNQQNEILTSRLNSAAKQFKAMMKIMRELQQKNNSLEEQINELKKENKTSTAFCGDAVEDAKEVKKEVIPTVQGNKEQIRTTNVEVKPSSTVKEDINENFDVEQIVDFFRKEYTDPQVAREMEIDILNKYKESRLSYYNRRDLEMRLNKYIKSLEIINSTSKEELPQEVQEPIEEETKKEETIPTVAMEVKPIQEELKELPQEAIEEVEEAIASRKEDKATEGKESTFVGMFQEVKSNCPICEERLRYQDLNSKTYYSSIEEAKAANVNPMFLYDSEVSRCVSTFN